MKNYLKKNKNEIIDFCILVLLIGFSYFVAFIPTANNPTFTKIHFYTLSHNIPVSIQTVIFMVMSLLSMIIYGLLNNTTKKIKEYSRY